jgi:hypothetical protein
VDGEVGRFEFDTFDVRDSLGRIVFHGFDAIPIRTGKQWHQTAGFKENAILRGVLDRSYRKTAIAFNIQRRQVKGGTPLNTLRDAAEAQGVAIMAAIEDETQRTFEEHHATVVGQSVVGIEPPAIASPPMSLPTFPPIKMGEEPPESNAIYLQWRFRDLVVYICAASGRKSCLERGKDCIRTRRWTGTCRFVESQNPLCYNLGSVAVVWNSCSYASFA